uniref:LITAF domain-containing protein n=1 Tax=Steinernema glaseri TaxID=37863 RepID=A0A1I7ZDN6_9BILA
MPPRPTLSSPSCLRPTCLTEPLQTTSFTRRNATRPSAKSSTRRSPSYPATERCFFAPVLSLSLAFFSLTCQRCGDLLLPSSVDFFQCF